MSRTNDGSAYLPTSLDFINLPNPIEPDGSGSQKHPLNGTPRLEKARLDSTPNQDLFSLILERNDERPPMKRQKTSDTALLDLPRLPIRNPAKRLRIPPTLSGLHQPPPDAGLLPSINVDQPQVLPPRQCDQVERESRENAPQKVIVTPAPPQADEPAASSPQPAAPKPKRVKRKWTDAETDALLKGVARFGIGSWTKILKCSDYDFGSRTALDLKDRFRVCRPDDYKSGKDQSTAEVRTIVHGPVPERVSNDKLRKLGITEPFGKKDRRAREEYTDAEDDALLRGFKKHGHQWAHIRDDQSLGLSSRKATDLRDHFRTRYPDEYAPAGRSSKAGKTDAVSKLAPEKSAEGTAPSKDSERLPEPPKATTNDPPEARSREESTVLKSSLNKRPHQPSLFALDDVFLNTPFDTADDEGEYIVLDRGILDWATEAAKPPAPDPLKNNGIDPRVTLMLPKPVSNIPPVAPPPVSNHNTSLPSLSSLLPDTVNPNQLELPSLTKWYESGGNDGRGSGVTIPALEELLGNLNDN